MRQLDPDHLARLYRDLFELDARGKVVIDDLVARFGRATIVTDGGIDAVLKTYVANGQRSVVDYVMRQINKANDAPDPNPPEGEAP